ncbi:MAG: 16S rRNA (guanine(966)-N(2))-methyltransferase RsmD [Candidatus Delongbacteria bacterium]|nr:16S rRNA (guanine(966)-N(2))-methyltransferase RsmD [Candidatus Cloacimonadota bacterium]MCB9474869.1 16S rRNA (guanine(966)-N(2))-methyltransferase RsmD [Candidatus Delongbacteria bacterium]
MMKVLFGRFKGRNLAVPAGLDVRPTTGRMRDWVCNVLRDRFPGITVLDLFAGSGSLGLHALSLGARHVTFVEQAPMALRAIHRNLETLGVTSGEALVLRRNVLQYTKEAAGRIKVELIFVDPPYESGLLQTLAEQLRHSELLQPGGLLLLEHPTGLDLDLAPLSLWKKKTFGRSTIQIWCNERDTSDGSPAAAGQD